MNRRFLLPIVLMAVLCPRTPILAEQLSDSRTLRETIAIEGVGLQRLIVDNIWGSVVPLPALPPTRRTQGNRTIIEVQRGTRVRVEDGGPTHSFETLNGNIYVRQRTSERGEDDA